MCPHIGRPITPVPTQPIRVFCGEISSFMPFRLLGCLATVERGGEYTADERGDQRLLRCPGPRAVQAGDVMGGEEIYELLRRVLSDRRSVFAGKVQAWLAAPPGQRERERGATCHLAQDAEHDGRIAVADVPLGPLGVATGRRLGELISLVDRPIFGEPAAWAPAAVRNAGLDGEGQSQPVRPRP